MRGQSFAAECRFQDRQLEGLEKLLIDDSFPPEQEATVSEELVKSMHAVVSDLL